MTILRLIDTIFLVAIVVFLLDIVVTTSGTIIAVKCIDGIVIAADSQSSSSTPSSSPFVSNRFLRKLFLLTPDTAICCAGGDSDFMQLYEKLKIELKKDEMLADEMVVTNNLKRTLGTSSIYNIARKYVYRKFPAAHLIVAGCDRSNNNSNKYNINNSSKLIKAKTKYMLFEVLPGGCGVEQEVVVSGSGAATAVSLLDELLSPEKRKDIGYSEATQVVSRVLSATMRMDRRTGGDVNVWVISDKQQQDDNNNNEEEVQPVRETDIERDDNELTTTTTTT